MKQATKPTQNKGDPELLQQAKRFSICFENFQLQASYASTICVWAILRDSVANRTCRTREATTANIDFLCTRTFLNHSFLPILRKCHR